MKDFESHLIAVCAKLDVEISTSTPQGDSNPNTVFNPALKRVELVQHIPCTAEIDPFSLPFIR